jgi:hypothetical protein
VLVNFWRSMQYQLNGFDWMVDIPLDVWDEIYYV